MSMRMASPTFDHNSVIPKCHTGDGEDLSPELSWSGVPNGTKELALICDDPDALTPKPWVHWVIYKLPADTAGLPEGVPTDKALSKPVEALQGKNSWNTIGYRGPAPPRGQVHHYHFKLYALDAKVSMADRPTKEQLLAAMNGHILAEAEIIGTYKR
ncbi:MAG: YbhB/YbcL family Raf kinase inhibitor-like protein [Planctomycetes bacterium]|nr:YbhB/YbcL family Raf kinase inhibitor-like protein [Planctomycetota bacterium]